MVSGYKVIVRKEELSSGALLHRMMTMVNNILY